MTSQPLGEAFVPIRATLDKLDSDLAEAKGKVKNALAGIGKTVQKAGKIALAGVANGVVAIATGIVAIAGQAIPAASNLNEALNATSVVFGDAASIVQDFGETAAESAGLSNAAFNQLAAQTGAMLQNYGFDAEEAALATVDLGQRAADMASIFNTDVDEALGAINAALRGEADPIERFGVSMNAAAVEAKALEMGLADATGELDTQALTQARLALLMEQTNAIAGDFVNTSDQLANAARVQSARWENFMADLGAFALPIITEVQNLFMDLAQVAMPLVLDAVGPVVEVFGNLVSVFAIFIQDLVSGMDPVTALGELVWSLAGYFVDTEEAATAVKTRFFELVAQVQETAAAVIELVAPIWESITGFVSMQDILTTIGILILSIVIPTVVSLVASMLPIIATVAAIVAIVALLRNAWENDWGGIRTSLTNWWNETGKPIFDMLRAWLSENIPKAIQTLKSFWENTLLPAIQAVWNWLSTTLIPFIKDVLIPWLQEKIPAAIAALSAYWTDTLKPAIETVWGFINEDLIPLFESVWELLEVTGGLALEALAGLWQNVLQPALETVWGYIDDKIIPIFNKLWENINEKLGPIFEFLGEKISTASGSFEDIKAAIQGVIEKIQALIEKLKNIELPPVFTPGSPTPFELGLLGINKALGTFNTLLDQNALISGPALNLNPTMNPAMAGMSTDATAGSFSYESNTNVYTNQDPLRVLRASRHLDRLAEIPE